MHARMTNIFLPQPKKWTPRKYQKEGIKWLLEHGAAALFLDPGMGKTSITLAALKILKAKGITRKVLLIAPLRPCYEVWPAERAKWEDFCGLTIEVLHGKDKDKALQRKADIYVINPAGLPWLLKGEKSLSPTGRKRVSAATSQFAALGFDTLVIDELTQFKHTNSQRFQLMKQVIHTFSRRWGLTGSPQARHLEDLFGQCYMLDEGNALGRYITHYRNEYFVPDHFGHNWTPKPDAKDRIYKRVAPLALRMDADDYLDLPQEVHNLIRVELPAAAHKTYKELERQFLSVIDGRVVSVPNAAAAGIKCRQVANGGVYMEHTQELSAPVRETAHLHTAKVDALEELIEGLQGSPVLIAYEFQHDLDRFRERFGKSIPVIGGGTNAKETARLIAAWNANELPWLFAHPASVAHGLNLQGGNAHHICWAGIIWDYELYMQFNYRLRRQGNKSKHTFIHHIIAKGTLDEGVYQALLAKAGGQKELFDYLKQWKKGVLRG